MSGPNIDLLCIRQSDAASFCENYAKLYFDAKPLEKISNSAWSNFWCPFWPISDAALFFWNRLCTLFEKCCNFYPNNFKFCAVKKNYKYLQQYCMEIWKCYNYSIVMHFMNFMNFALVFTFFLLQCKEVYALKLDYF